MKKLLASIALCTLSLMSHAQENEVMVIEKNDNSSIQINVSDIRRVHFDTSSQAINDVVANPQAIMTFADPTVKALLIQAGVDRNLDSEISYAEAAAVYDFISEKGINIFFNKDIVSFDELRYFKGIKSLSYSYSNSHYQGTFGNCILLKSIILPSTLLTIGHSAFIGCTGLTSIEIPNSVTSIGRSAFHSCTGLTSIEIPNSVTSIGDNAFYNCIGLTSIEIPNSVTSISGYTFRDCTGLTSIEIPNSVTSIGGYAFVTCI